MADLRDLIDDFTAAAMGLGAWDDALRALAERTGSARGQLIGVGAAGSVPFNWATDLDAKAFGDIEAIDGHNPAVNPRIATAFDADVLELVSERDYDVARPRLRRHDGYDDFVDAYDIPHGCQTTLVREHGLLIGLGVLRTRRDGRTNAAERAIFATLAPHVRVAVRTQMLLEGQKAPLLAETLEAVALPAFVCGAGGAVQALTPTAETLLRETPLVSLRDRRLGSPDRAGLALLEAALVRVERGGAPTAATVVLRDPASLLPPLVVDVLPVPRGRWSLALEARALVVPRRPRRVADAASVLSAGYRLTAAEAAIALALASGAERGMIAAMRGVSIGTVRAQLKSVFLKMGVTREVDLVARINALG